jgi:DNA-binding MarR family transcriptional regulator
MSGSYHRACGYVCYTITVLAGSSIPWNPVGRAVPDLPALYSELVRFETELWDAIDARLRSDCNLPLGRFEVTRVIARHGRCRVQDIADELAITIGGASKIVDRLEASGYCGRRPNPEDQRSSLIELTPAGECIFARAIEVFEAELARRFGAVLSARSLEQFRTTLAKLRAAGHRLDHREPGSAGSASGASQSG